MFKLYKWYIVVQGMPKVNSGPRYAKSNYWSKANNGNLLVQGREGHLMIQVIQRIVVAQSSQWVPSGPHDAMIT